MKNDFRAILREAGFKATPARLKLLSLLAKSSKPLGIQDIIDKLGKSEVDQATVYRVLKLLIGLGLVRQVDVRHGHADYEFVSDHDHHHLICLNCGRMEDFTGCDLEDIKKQALKKSSHFKSISQHSLEFFGLCRSCETAVK